MPLLLIVFLTFIGDINISGSWKSPVDSSTFSYGDSLLGRELYPSPNFSSSTKGSSLGFAGNSSLTAAASGSLYWPKHAETVCGSFTPLSGNRESGEKRHSSGSGCRLFGIQLLDSSNVDDNLLAAGDDRPIQSADADSDQHSEPSDLNRSNVQSLSCDPDKSCLKSSQESHGRQIRSCTKVIIDSICVEQSTVEEQ